MNRRCGWVPAALETPVHVVWARGEVFTDECPKSSITAQSLTWIEECFIWKQLGLDLRPDLNIRTAEAFLVLEEQLTLEKQGGTAQNKQSNLAEQHDV
jgi:hypothetical protein